MDEPKERMTNLILAVCRLCDETRDLATSDPDDTQALGLVQDAADLVTLAIGRVRESQGASALPPALPVESLEDATAENWLLGDD